MVMKEIDFEGFNRKVKEKRRVKHLLVWWMFKLWCADNNVMVD